MQKELDERIMELHGQSRESTQRKRILALLVEIAELANETRSFKYWSLKKASDHDVLIEEFSDTLHFILSLALDLNFESFQMELEIESKELSHGFIDWMAAVINWDIHFDSQHLEAVMKEFLSVAIQLGFDDQMIIEAYLKKNKKNHHRQDNAY
jgi:dimeric dUTPase (all-alpha-NTP-PPase superfamily)